MAKECVRLYRWSRNFVDFIGIRTYRDGLHDTEKDISVDKASYGKNNGIRLHVLYTRHVLCYREKGLYSIPIAHGSLGN